MQSSQARTAKEIRVLLKSMNIPASVTSTCYAGGDSVRVNITNQPPAVVEQIKKLTNKYQYGHFDGMIDLYEYSNTRSDIPQTKYLMIENSFDDEYYEKAYQYIKEHYGGMETAPNHYKDAFSYWNDNFKAHGSTIVGRILRNTGNLGDAELWKLLGIKNEPVKEQNNEKLSL